MSDNKNDTLKKVFRLTHTRKIAVIEPDVTTYQESIGAFMRRMRDTNIIQDQQENHATESHNSSADLMENEPNSLLESDVNAVNGSTPSDGDELKKFLRLKELYTNIIALEDDDDLQAIVDLVTESDCYEMNSESFDFDLMKLNSDTIEKLKAFVAVSAVGRQESERETKLRPKATENLKVKGYATDYVKSENVKTEQRKEDTDHLIKEVKVKKKKVATEITPVNWTMKKVNERTRKAKKFKEEEIIISTVVVAEQKNGKFNKIAEEKVEKGNRCSRCGKRRRSTGKNNTIHTCRRLTRKHGGNVNRCRICMKRYKKLLTMRLTSVDWYTRRL